jgi:hypothetical protein
MNENKTNQVLTGRATLSLFLLLGVVLSLFAYQFKGPSLGNEHKDSARLESLAYQVIEFEKRKTGAREPASIVGKDTREQEIGSDPWGRSYLYKYIEIQGQQSLLLWSRGPDGLTQIEASSGTDELHFGKSSERRRHIQTADDFGVILRLEQ